MSERKKIIGRRDKKTDIMQIIFPLLAVLLGFVLGGVLIAISGKNVLEAYGALFRGAFGSVRAISGTLGKATPLIFAGLALSYGFKCKVFNMGGEGQLLMGGLVSALIGVYCTGLPSVLHLPLTILGGMAAGALWSVVPALLKVKRGVHEVISTIMMNNIGALLVSYLIMSVFKAPGEINATPKMEPSALIGGIELGGVYISYSLFLAIASAAAVYLFLNKTSKGYEIIAVGLNQDAADYVGINSRRNIFMVFLFSGALVSLAGITEVAGNYGRIYDGFSPGYGATGIAIALLANCNPFGVLLSAFLFGALSYGSAMMQTTVGISKEIVGAIQAFIVLLVAAEKIVKQVGRGRR